MATATHLPFATYLRHSATSVPDSSKALPKYLNSNTCSNRAPSTPTRISTPISPPLLIPARSSFVLTFRPQRNASPSPSGLPSTRHTKPSHLHARGRQSPLSPLFQKLHCRPPYPHFHSFHHCINMHVEEPRGTRYKLVSQHFQF